MVVVGLHGLIGGGTTDEVVRPVSLVAFGLVDLAVGAGVLVLFV